MLFAAILMMAGFTTTVMAQSAQDNTAKAVLKIPISLAVDHIMDFAVLSGSATAGTVEMAATLAATLTPSTGVHIVSGTPYAGKYTVTGEPSTIYTITIPITATTITDGGSASMTVENMTCSIPVTAGAGSLAAITGLQSFYVGGTLHIGADQIAGTYTGLFEVSVNY